MKQCILLFLISALFVQNSLAQEVFPEISLKQMAPGKIYISWHHTLKDCIQLSIQKSVDNKNFKTIRSAPDPGIPNGNFTDDNTIKNQPVYYRILYVLKGGRYFFTSIQNIVDVDDKKNDKKDDKKVVAPITTQTQTPTPTPIKPLPPAIYKPSPYVFTNKNGFVQIMLDEPSKHYFRLVFKEENGKEIFEMKKIISENLVLDNANFLHKGWFNFELFRDEVLLDKNKVLIKVK